MAVTNTPAQRKRKQFSVIASILIVIYLIEIVGILSPYRDAVLKLTPIFLLLTAAAMFWFHGGMSQRFMAFSVATLLFGYLVEVIRIKLVPVFGEYHYGTSLGSEIMGVPPIVGVYWLILIYSIGCVVGRFQVKTPLMKAVISSFFIITLSFFIEHLAPQLNFWQHKEDVVPIQNYALELLFSFVFLYGFFKLKLQDMNPMAPIVALLQVTFWGLLTLFL